MSYKKFSTVAKNFRYEIVQMELNKDDSVYCHIFKEDYFIGDCNIKFIDDKNIIVKDLVIDRRDTREIGERNVLQLLSSQFIVNKGM